MWARTATALLFAVVAAPLAAADLPPQPEKRICRAAAAQLGSKIKRRKDCRTAAQWEEADAARRAAPLRVKAPQPEAWERTRPQ
jgi:hypothetical protein